MNEMTQWGGGSSPMPRRQSMAAKRTTKGIVEKVQQDGLEIDGDAALTAKAMERVADLDALRHQLATSNELNQLLFQLEAGFAGRASRQINNRNSPFGF